MRCTLRLFITLSLLTCFLNSTIHAQAKNNVNNLLQLNNSHPQPDTNKINILFDIAEAYEEENPEEAVKFLDEAAQLATSNHYESFIAKAAIKKGVLFSRFGLYEEALKLFTDADLIFEKLRLFNEVAESTLKMGAMHIYLGNPSNSLDLFFKAKRIFEQTGAHKKVANVYNSIAAAYMSMAENDKALSYFEKSYEINKKYHNDLGIARYFYNTGTIYLRKGIYAKALDLIQESQKIYERIGSQEDMADIFRNLSILYSEVGDPNKSLEYNQKALEIYKNLNNWPDVAITLMNIGNSYRLLDEHYSALNAYKESMKILETTDSPVDKVRCLNNMCGIYMEIKDYKNAFDCWHQGTQINETVGDLDLVTYITFYTGSWFHEAPDSLLYLTNTSPKERWQKAESLLLQADTQAEKTHSLFLRTGIWQELSTIYEEKGDFKRSLKSFETFILYRDSIQGQDIKNQITRKEIQFEFDKKETVLKFEQQLTRSQLEKQTLLSVQQRQALTIANKEKDLQRLAYLKEKAEKQEKEQQLALAEKDKQLQAADLATLAGEKALQLKSLAEKNALIGFLIASLMALILGIFAFYAWQRQKRALLETAVQQQFTQQLFQNTEEERGRIARDLHDGVSHELLALRRELQNDSASKRIDHIISDIRQISRNLHPVMLESIGLQLSLETLCDQYMEQHELFITHDIQYPNRMSKANDLQLFRIVQEALTNTIKYADADAVKVSLSAQNNGLQLIIQDNGRGFDVAHALANGKAFGLNSILQRTKAIGGKATLQSSGEGTVIRVDIQKA